MSIVNHLTEASKAKRMRNLFQKHYDISITTTSGMTVRATDIAVAMQAAMNRHLEKFVQTASPQEIVRNAYKIANMVRQRHEPYVDEVIELLKLSNSPLA